jgi:hypothetical protein
MNTETVTQLIEQLHLAQSLYERHIAGTYTKPDDTAVAKSLIDNAINNLILYQNTLIEQA